MVEDGTANTGLDLLQLHVRDSGSSVSNLGQSFYKLGLAMVGLESGGAESVELMFVQWIPLFFVALARTIQAVAVFLFHLATFPLKKTEADTAVTYDLTNLRLLNDLFMVGELFVFGMGVAAVVTCSVNTCSSDTVVRSILSLLVLEFLLIILRQWGKAQLWEEVMNAENGSLVLRIMCKGMSNHKNALSHDDDVGTLLCNLPWLKAYDLRDAFKVATLVGTVLKDERVVDHKAIAFAAWLHYIATEPEFLSGARSPQSCREWYKDYGMVIDKSSFSSFFDTFGDTPQDQTSRSLLRMASLNQFRITVLPGRTDELTFPAGAIVLRRTKPRKWNLEPRLKQAEFIRDHRAAIALILSSGFLIFALFYDLRALSPYTVLALSIFFFFVSLPFVLISFRIIWVGMKESQGSPFPFLRKKGRLEFALASFSISTFLISQYLSYIPTEGTDTVLGVGLYIFLASWSPLLLIVSHQGLMAFFHSCLSNYGWKSALEAQFEEKWGEIV
jgi:hypothetical protein